MNIRITRKNWLFFFVSIATNRMPGMAIEMQEITHNDNSAEQFHAMLFSESGNETRLPAKTPPAEPSLVTADTPFRKKTNAVEPRIVQPNIARTVALMLFDRNNPKYRGFEQWLRNLRKKRPSA